MYSDKEPESSNEVDSQKEPEKSEPCNPTLVGSIASMFLAGAVSIPFLAAGLCPSVNSLSLMPWMVARSKGFVKWVNVLWLCLFSLAAGTGLGVINGILMSYPGVLILQRLKYQEMGSSREAHVQLIPLTLECLAGFLLGSGYLQIYLPGFLKEERSYDIPESKMCVGMLQVVENSHLCEAPWLGQALVAPIALVIFIIAGNLSGIVPGTLSLPLFPKDLVSSRGLDITESLKSSAITFPGAGDIMILGIGAILPFRLVVIFVAGAVVKSVGSIFFLQIRTGGIFENWQSAEYIQLQFPDGLCGHWTGAGSMGVCIVVSMIKAVISLRTAMKSKAEETKKLIDSEEKSNASEEERKKLLHIPNLYKNRQMAIILAGFLVHACVLVMFDAKWSYIAGNLIISVFAITVANYFSVILTFTLGSSSAPISGPMLIMGLLHCGNLLVTVGLPSSDSALGVEFVEKYVPLLFLTLSMHTVAACVATNSSQDLATMYLMKMKVTKGFAAQVISGFPVVFLAPAILLLAEKTYGIGTGLAAPQASMYASVFGGVLWGSPAWWPLCIGAVIGLSAVFLDEILSRKCGVNFPPVAFSVGLYLPSSVALGMFIASVAKLLGQHLHVRMTGQADASNWITQEFNICAAALLAGFSLFRLSCDLFLCVAGIEMNAVEMTVMTVLLGVVSIALIWICLVYNAYTGHLDPTVAAKGSNADGKDVEMTAPEKK